MALSVVAHAYSGALTIPPTTVSVQPTASGQLIVVIAAIDSASTPSPSVSSSPSLSWTKQYLVAVGGCLTAFVAVFYAVSSSSSPISITVNAPGAAYCDVEAIVIAGANNSSPFDPNSSLPASGVTPLSTSFSVNFSTSVANAMIIAAAGTCHNSVAGFNTSFGSPTLLDNGGYDGYSYIVASGTVSNQSYTVNLSFQDGAGLFVFAIDPSPPPPPPASFTLQVQFSPAYVAQGQELLEDIDAILQQGSVGPVTFSISGLPPGASASFSPQSCTPTCVTLLTIQVGPDTPIGTYNLTITGNASSTSASAQLILNVVGSTAKVAEVNCYPSPPSILSEVQEQALRIAGTRALTLPPEEFTKLPPAADPAIPCALSSPIETYLDVYVYGSGLLQGVTVRLVKENSPFIVKQTDVNGHVYFSPADMISPRTGKAVSSIHLDFYSNDITHACAWANINISGPGRLEVTLVPVAIIPFNGVVPLQYKANKALQVFNSGESACPGLPSQYIQFSVSTDPTYLLVSDVQSIPGMRLTGGGILLKSSGVFQQVQPFQAPPPFPGSGLEYPTGIGIPYYSGIVIYLGNGSSQYLCQLDARGFLLFRSVLGTVTVPLLDNFSYLTNGSVSSGVATLSQGEYILFYPAGTIPPPVGNYITSDVEQAGGAAIQLVLTNGSVVSFNARAGNGTFRIITNLFTLSSGWINYFIPKYSQFGSGDFNLPGYIIYNIAWSWRQYDGNGTALGPAILADWSNFLFGHYMDDPNVVTWDQARSAMELFYPVPTSLLTDMDFGYSSSQVHYDSTDTFRVRIKESFHFKNLGSMWKVRVYLADQVITNTYNYDEGGSTTGFSARTWGTTLNPSVNGMNSIFYLYNGSWVQQSLGSGWTWLDGYWAVRGSLPPTSPAINTCYIYAKYLIGSSNQAPIVKDGDYRFSHYSGSPDNEVYAVYFNDWADVTLPAGWEGGEVVEFWFAESDTYEANPAKPLFTNNTGWIEQFFPVL